MFVRRVIRGREKKKTQIPSPAEMNKRIKAMIAADLMDKPELTSLISTGKVPPEGLGCIKLLTVKELSIPLLA
jgi:hypothetical protein